MIYNLGCECGAFYIGETGRSLNIRMKEHKAACRLASFEESAVVEHAWQDGHCVNWEDAEVLDTARDLQVRKTKEALYIKMTPSGCRINRDEGRDLPPLWLRTIKKLKSKHPGHKPRRPHPPQGPQTSFTPSSRDAPPATPTREATT